MSTHAPIAPSALSLTVVCPASVGLQASVVPLPPTDEELEGTAAHWIAMQYAAGNGASWPVGAKFASGGREWTVDIDMVTGAVMYAQACGGTHRDLRLEDAVKCSEIHPTHCWGTPDAWRYYPDAREAFAEQEVPNELQNEAFYAGRAKLVRDVDYKYGHRYVEVYGCYQLIAYVSGVLERLQLSENDPDLWVEMILVQPRCYHREGPVRRWIIRVSALRAWINHAAAAAREALGPSPRAQTNDACIDCEARHACVVKQRSAQALIEFSGSAELVDLPPDAMGQELALVQDAIKRLEARETGLKARVEALIRNGARVPFYGMEPGESRLIYKEDVDVDEFVGFGDLIGIDVRKKLTKKDLMVTPTQAIALGVDANAMKSYAHRPPAALKLVRDNSTAVSKVFK